MRIIGFLLSIPNRFSTTDFYIVWMKIYKIKYLDGDNRSNLELMTAKSQEDVVRMMDNSLEIQEVMDCGPYINEGVYKELRKEILDR